MPDENIHESAYNCEFEIPINFLVPFSFKPTFAPQKCTFQLCNHPGGNASPPPYGLRLDGLLTGNPRDIYTFDFEYKGAEVFLDYTSTGEIHIYGKAFGGQKEGKNYKQGTTDYWDIDFTYKVVGHKNNDAYVTEKAYGTYKIGMGKGTIKSKKFKSFDLVDYFGDHEYSFRFGDDTEHRGYKGISGWGWLNHSHSGAKDRIYNHLNHSDWLFVAKIPKLSMAKWKMICWSGLASGVWSEDDDKKYDDD